MSLSRTRLLAAAVCAVAGVLALGRLVRSPGAPPPAAPPIVSTPAAGAGAPPSPAVLVVDVAGAVRRPGLYRLRAGARIADALARAGGATARADTALVNLAAPLADGEQVLVPARVPGAGGATAGGGPAAPGGPLDLNAATAAQLDALPGIGPVTAQKIVDYRQAHGPFRSVDDLAAIPGIGPAKIDDLRGLVIPP